MSHVFISYSRHDRDYARKLADSLLERGFDVWIDDRIEYGENWERAVFNAVRECSSFVVIMSPNSEHSTWVPRECAYAEQCGKLIYPVLLDGDVFPRYLLTQYADVLGGRLPPGSFYELLGRQTPQKTTRGTEHRPPVEASTPKRNSPDFVVARIGPANFRSIADAIEKVPEGSTIHVKPGLYAESLVLNKPVELIGDGLREEIVIDSTRGKCIWMYTDYAVVRGLTLRQRSGPDERNPAVYIPQGRLVLEDCDLTSQETSCLIISGHGTDPIVRRCRIHNGNSDGAILRDGSNGIVEDCDIFDNGSVGVVIRESANPIIRRCQIYQNKEAGVYIHTNATGSLEHCVINNNFLGIHVHQQSNPTIRSCTITGNTFWGIVVSNDAKGVVASCDLRGNLEGSWYIDDTSQITQRDNQE